jgi:tetratricopeptide (TPR) repeat protein
MNGSPEEQKARFDRAIDRFREPWPVRVTAEKVQAFLDETQDSARTAANRLRWLAIGLEHARFEQGWAGLRAIYQAAQKADPTDSYVLHSWGISARNWAVDWMTPDPAERVAIAAEAERVLRGSLELTPRNSPVAHALGLVYYFHPSAEEDRELFLSLAIEWFSLAVEWDSTNVMAQLYIAHCFHDRKDWPRTIAEYEKVDLERLSHDWPAWRAVKCREQLAQCHASAGNTAEAVRRFTEFLNEVEPWDEQKLQECIINIDELVVALTDALDHPELLRRTRALASRLKLDKRYQKNFSESRTSRAEVGGRG